MFYMIDPPDPEQVRAMRDSQEAHATSHYLELYGNLESLTPEQLDCVIMLVGRSLESPQFGYHITGVLYGMKRYKHNICGCASGDGEHKVSDHSDPDWILQTMKEENPVTTEDVEGPLKPRLAEGSEPLKEEDAADPKVSIVTHRGEQEWLPISEALTRYDLETYVIPVPGDSRVMTGVRCRKCQLQYQSIADRALEPPGVAGCMGCIQIAKTGGGDPWKG